MSGGITAEGFELPTVEELLADIGADQLSTIDPALDISPDQPLGQINAIVAKKLAEAWEALQTAYNAFSRAAAEGYLLDNLGLLTGTIRNPATKSRVLCTLNIDATTTIPQGSVINVAGQPTVRFELEEEFTSTTGPTTYKLYFSAIDSGPVAANAGTLTVITTPVAGWNSVTNDTDATLGAVEESDADYRLRQIEELAAPGSCTVDAIRAELLQIDGVLAAYVFENTTMVTDGDGVPPKAYECVIWDGETEDADDDVVGQTIWDNKPSGIETYGSIDVTVEDSTGVERTVYFSRGTQVPVYFIYTLDVDVNTYPVDGDDQVKDIAVAKADDVLGLGSDVIALVFRAEALKVTGVIDVTDFRLGTAPAPSGTANISIASREIATLSTANITVNS